MSTNPSRCLPLAAGECINRIIMLTQRSRYALRALIFLARSSSIAPVPMSAIAADQKLPRKFLEIILLELKNGGLVTSSRFERSDCWARTAAGARAVASLR